MSSRVFMIVGASFLVFVGGLVYFLGFSNPGARPKYAKSVPTHSNPVALPNAVGLNVSPKDFESAPKYAAQKDRFELKQWNDTYDGQSIHSGDFESVCANRLISFHLKLTESQITELRRQREIGEVVTGGFQVTVFDENLSTESEGCDACGDNQGDLFGIGSVSNDTWNDREIVILGKIRQHGSYFYRVSAMRSSLKEPNSAMETIPVAKGRFLVSEQEPHESDK